MSLNRYGLNPIGVYGMLAARPQKIKTTGFEVFYKVAALYRQVTSLLTLVREARHREESLGLAACMLLSSHVGHP